MPMHSLLTAAFGLVFAITSVSAQDLEQTIFGSAQAKRDAAEAANVILLSPRAYQRGVQEFETAKRDFEKGRNLEGIKGHLAEASDYFDKAIANAEVARVTLRKAIDSRNAANQAEAFRLAPGDWADAEKQFNEAALDLEKGKLDSTRERGDEANTTYRLAELNAIRARHLSEARRLIAEADQRKVEKFAPLTLGKARDLLQQADASIVRDRYSPDEAIALAAQASYEARHAVYIAEIVNRVREDETSVEAVILDWELPIAEIAAALEVDPDFRAGYTQTSEQIMQAIREALALRNELAQRDLEIRGLEDELRELDARLGGAAAERTSLVRTLERQARVREQFAQVQNMFAPSEAIVLRDANNLIIRLTGLSFATNSSQLDATSIELINRLEEAINVFPQCDLIVEGHTDSQGNANRNLELSNARAQSVRNYLIEEMRIPDYRIKAVGYGDSRPISNNRTAEGRAKNRRIDMIIIPKPGSL